MSIYSYPESKVIDQVTFKKTANGAVRAYVHARPDIDEATVHTIINTLRGANCECIPYTLDGKPAMEVRGFANKEAKLLTLLDKNKWVDAKVEVTKEADDNVGWIDMVKKRSLQASGAAMMVADVGFAMYGAKEKSWEDTLAGLSYLSGSATLLAYGRNDQSTIQIREMANLILNHAREKGFVIPEESSAATIGKPQKDNVFRKVDNFFRAYPSEIGNMMYVAAGAFIAKSALQHRALAKPRPGMTAEQISKMRKGGWGDTVLGFTTVASGLLATFVKEKAHDPDTPKAEGVGSSLVEWVRASPLRIASYGYIGSTLCHAYTTFIERSEAKRALKDLSLPAVERALAADKLKAIPWRVLFVSATLVGELLLSISSKGHGEGVVSDSSVDDSTIAVAADLIVKQPLAMQDHLIEQMSKFLGRPDVLAMKDEDVTKQLRTQVEALRKNPWALAEKATAKPVTIPAPPKTDVPAWQAKVAAADAATPQLQTSA